MEQMFDSFLTRSRVLLVDPNPIYRTAVAGILSHEGGHEVVGLADRLDEAERIARQKDPTLIILDPSGPGGIGQKGLAVLREAAPMARIAVLSADDSPNNVMSAVRSGADGYLLKTIEAPDLVARVSDILSGRMVLSDALADTISDVLRETPQSVGRNFSDLTGREKEVLRCIAAGMSNKAIAAELHITDGTVKVHVKHLLKKLGFNSRVEAAVWAAAQNPA